MSMAEIIGKVNRPVTKCFDATTCLSAAVSAIPGRADAGNPVEVGAILCQKPAHDTGWGPACGQIFPLSI